MNFILNLFFVAHRFAGNPVSSLFALALLSHLSLSSVLFLPPFVMLLQSSPRSALASVTKSSALRFGSSVKLSCIYAIFLSFASLCSFITTGGWDWMYRTWGTRSMAIILAVHYSDVVRQSFAARPYSEHWVLVVLLHRNV